MPPFCGLLEQTTYAAAGGAVHTVETRRGSVMAPIGVLLVDDSPLFLATTARILAKDSRVRIVGQALSGGSALEQLPQLNCDLVLLDIAMPEMSGLEVAQRLRELPVPPRIVLLSLNDLTEYREAAANCADAFLDKSQAATELLPLIRSLFAEDPAPAK